MPPTIKINQDKILSAAFVLVRRGGMSTITARNLAKELGCSVQPIFREFENMEELKQVIIKKIEVYYNEKMFNALQSSGEFSAMGMAYIDFAKTEPEFFRVLFMSNQFSGKKLNQIAGETEGDDEMLALLSHKTDMTAEQAQILYTSIWLTTHGIASMVATNTLQISKEEAKHILGLTFEGLIHSIKKEVLS